MFIFCSFLHFSVMWLFHGFFKELEWAATLRKTFPQNMPWYSNILQKFGNFHHFGGFLHFFCLWLGHLYRFFKELEPNDIHLCTLQRKFFLNLPEDSKYCRNLVILLIWSVLFIFFTRQIWSIASWTLPDLIM